MDDAEVVHTSEIGLFSGHAAGWLGRVERRRWQTLGAELTDLVWPRTCAGCATPGVALCVRCRGRTVPAVLDDLTAGPAEVPVVAAAAYDAGVRRALIAYKERRRRELARPLGRLLRAAVDVLLTSWADPARPFVPPSWSGVLLVPVPSTPAARRRRGDDHVRRLALAAGRPRAARPRSVLRVSGTGERRDDLEVGLAERMGGAGRYRARAPGPGAAPVVVVDDIVTSGATARDAVVALQRAGWRVLGVAAVAATPRVVPRLPAARVGPAP